MPIAALLTGLLILAAALDLQRAVIALGFCLLLVVPMRLTSFSTFSQRGIAESAPELTTFGIATVVFALMALHYRDRARLPLTLWLFIGYLAVGMVFFWTSNLLQWSGIEQYLLAPLGFVAGTFVIGFARRNAVNACWLAATVTAAMLLQVAVSLLQLTGVRFLSSFGVGIESISRTAGTTPNPNILGTIAFFALLILLPLTRHDWRRTSRTAMLGVVACCAVQALCAGRANYLASVAVLVGWAVLTPRVREGFGRRSYLAVAGAATIVGAIRLTSRFVADPVGQERQELVGKALGHASDYLLTGMGPNNYLVYLYGDDPALFGRAQAVHNIFLLSTAELGVVGGVLLLLPWVITTVRAGHRTITGEGDLYSRLALSAFLPIALIGMLDKAILALGMLPLFFLVIGMCQPAAGSGSGSRRWRWPRRGARTAQTLAANSPTLPAM